MENRDRGWRAPELRHDSLFWSRAHSQATECLSGRSYELGAVPAALLKSSFQPHDVLMHGAFHMGPRAHRVTRPESHSEDRAKLEFPSRESKRIHIFPILSEVVSEASEKANGLMKAGGVNPPI